MKLKLNHYWYFLLLLVLPSCKTINPNLMFQQKDYQFFQLKEKASEEYVIQPGDELTIRVFARDGFRLIDIVGMETGREGFNGGYNSSRVDIEDFVVDKEGFAKLPIIGATVVAGYTHAQLEKMLEEKYANLYVSPYVIVRVLNRRAFVFKGSIASVINLNRAPTTLFEVIAKSGGVGENIKAYKVKVIRGDYKNPEITLINLRTIEGMRKADLIIQSNDIVYIEERQRWAQRFLLDAAPYLGLAATITSITSLITILGTR